MRRSFIGFFFVFLCLFTYLYWHQIRIITNKIKPDKSYTFHKHKIYNKPSTKKYYSLAANSWKWTCINNHCERQEKFTSELDNNDANQGYSLRTCNMLCGSTQLWPQPTGPISLGSLSIPFSSDQFELKMQAPYEVRPMVEEMFEIFKRNVEVMVDDNYLNVLSATPATNVLKTSVLSFNVTIVINKPETKINLNTNESYTLDLKVNSKRLLVKIMSETYFGARHGLETLSQLIWWDEHTHSLRTLKLANIVDAPKFAYRGLMLDTSRHYFSIEAIRRTLDGMAASKLNAFHWHISDSQSFPFDSPRQPEMVKTGAFNPQHIYTADDIRDISNYARIRGIKIIIEIDTPAHAGMGWTWGPSKGLGELAVCVGQQPWSIYCGEPPCGQLNPNNPNVFRVLENLYRDIIELTDETEVFHIGGDEVNLECWSQHLLPSTGGSSDMNMYRSNLDLHDVWGNFTIRALGSLKAANKGKIPPVVIVWSSNLAKQPYLTKYLDRNHIVVQDWSPTSWADSNILWNNDYRTILSHVDAWYLDCGFGKWREIGAPACDPYRTWQTVYTHRPWLQMNLPQDRWHLILGGEACLWSEQVGEQSLDTRLWPRAAALAERLWSDIPFQKNMDTEVSEDTYTRLDTHTARLRDRGINSEAMWPEWCTYNPGMCL